MRTSRINQIESYILERDTVTLEELCDRYAISLSTLRRDLNELQKKGSIRKVYGGAQKSDGAAQTGSLLPFHTRSGVNPAEKTAICAAASRLVEENDIIFIDTGSTTCGLVDHLGHLNEVTVITNNMDVVIRAVAYPNINLYVLQGLLNRANNSFSPLAGDTVLGDFNIKKAFMAASGLSLQNNVSHNDPLESATKRAAVNRAEQLYLMVDHTKFGHTCLRTYAQLTDFGCIITDAAPEKEYRRFFEANDIQLICP